MKSLNEKLAEVCGIKLIGDQRGICEGESELWNPAGDLNQLRECYLAADESFVPEHEEVTFDVAFAFALRNLLVDTECSPMTVGLASAWVKHPELVAQAILKAKGVEG
jgi:hypothetical protein